MFLVNANTDTKSTVSVIRVGSPTPSMGANDNDCSTKRCDNDENNESDDDDDNNGGSINSGDSNDDTDHDGGSTGKRKKSKKKKKKNKVPSYGLTVEDFYDPEQAIKFATENMSKMSIY